MPTSNFKICGKSRTKTSILHLQLSVFEGPLARKLRYHICDFHFLREVSRDMDARDASTCCVLQNRACLGRLMGKFCMCETVPGVLGPFSDRLLTAYAVSGVVLPTSSCWFLREGSRESFVFTFSTLTLSGNSLTFEGTLSRKFRFHSFTFHFFRDVSHESFAFHIFNFQILREVSHQSFNITSHLHSTFALCGKSRTKLRCHIFNLEFLKGYVFTFTRASKSYLFRLERSGFRAAISGTVARSRIVFCNSVSADPTPMAATRFIGAAAG